MPIFEYICKSCENEFETLVMNSDEHINCSCCGSDKLEKLFSSFASHDGSDSLSADVSETPSMGGGCCGSACGCGH